VCVCVCVCVCARACKYVRTESHMVITEVLTMECVKCAVLSNGRPCRFVGTYHRFLRPDPIFLRLEFYLVSSTVMLKGHHSWEWSERVYRAKSCPQSLLWLIKNVQVCFPAASRPCSRGPRCQGTRCCVAGWVVPTPTAPHSGKLGFSGFPPRSILSSFRNISSMWVKELEPDSKYHE